MRLNIKEFLQSNPARFIYGPRPLKGRKGMTKRSYWNRVIPDDPRYADAPFETTLIPPTLRGQATGQPVPVSLRDL